MGQFCKDGKALENISDRLDSGGKRMKKIEILVGVSIVIGLIKIALELLR